MEFDAEKYLQEIKEAFVAGFESGLKHPYHFADEKESLVESEFNVFVKNKVEKRKPSV